LIKPYSIEYITATVRESPGIARKPRHAAIDELNPSAYIERLRATEYRRRRCRGSE